MGQVKQAGKSSFVSFFEFQATYFIIGAVLLLMLSGCATATRNIDMNNDKGQAVMGLDYRDFQKAASEAIKSMLQSGALNKRGGGRYVLAISRIVNDTMQRINTDQLIKKIRVELLQSGKVVVTTAVSAGEPEDKMSMKANRAQWRKKGK